MIYVQLHWQRHCMTDKPRVWFPNHEIGIASVIFGSRSGHGESGFGSISCSVPPGVGRLTFSFGRLRSSAELKASSGSSSVVARVLAMNRSLPPLRLSVSQILQLANTALRNAGASPTRERIRPMRRDCHCGRTGEFIPRACIACRHYAIDSNTSKLLTRQEARGARRCPLQRFESALDAQRPRNRGQMCQTKRDNAPPDMLAIPKAPHYPVAKSLFRVRA